MEKRIIELEKGLLNLYRNYNLEKKTNYELSNTILQLQKKILLIEHKNNYNNLTHSFPDQKKELENLIANNDLERKNLRKKIKNKIVSKNSINVLSKLKKKNDDIKNGFVVF